MKIFSKIDQSIQISAIIKYKDLKFKREFYSDDSEFLQFMSIKTNSKLLIKAHKHIQNIKKVKITQEAWIIIKGKIKVFFYDIDKAILFEDVLEEGDACVLYNGSHSLEKISKDLVLYEIKNGPFYSMIADKENI